MSDYLDAKQTKVEFAPDGTLRAITAEKCGLDVQVLRAMPLAVEDEFIVLRDGKNKELGILENLEGMDAASRDVIEKALRKRYFLPKILKINGIQERFNSADWDVETDRGPFHIQTKAIHESVIELGGGRILLKDNEENRYEIPNLAALDEISRAKFAGKV
jgi:hypothetical protein